MSTEKVLELERERDAWKKLAREEGQAKLDYLYDAAMLQTKVDELQAELAQPCDCGTLTAQLAEANQRAERAEKERDDLKGGFPPVGKVLMKQADYSQLVSERNNHWREVAKLKQTIEKQAATARTADRRIASLSAALSAGVLPEGAVCFVPTGEPRSPKEGEMWRNSRGKIGIAQYTWNKEATRQILVPWHPPKAEPAKETPAHVKKEIGDAWNVIREYQRHGIDERFCMPAYDEGSLATAIKRTIEDRAAAYRDRGKITSVFAEPPKVESGEGEGEASEIERLKLDRDR